MTAVENSCSSRWDPRESPSPGHYIDTCNCPPTTCDECGETNPPTTPCSCWISLDGLPLADIKALFASSDCELSIDPAVNDGE